LPVRSPFLYLSVMDCRCMRIDKRVTDSSTSASRSHVTCVTLSRGTSMFTKKQRWKPLGKGLFKVKKWKIFTQRRGQAWACRGVWVFTARGHEDSQWNGSVKACWYFVFTHTHTHTKAPQNSVVGVSTRHGLDGARIESRCSQVYRTPRDRPWGSPSFLYNGHRVSFPRVKRPGRGINHPPQSSDEFK
jgi:hypothetical protein